MCFCVFVAYRALGLAGVTHGDLKVNNVLRCKSSARVHRLLVWGNCVTLWTHGIDYALVDYGCAIIRVRGGKTTSAPSAGSKRPTGADTSTARPPVKTKRTRRGVMRYPDPHFMRKQSPDGQSVLRQIPHLGKMRREWGDVLMFLASVRMYVSPQTRWVERALYLAQWFEECGYVATRGPIDGCVDALTSTIPAGGEFVLTAAMCERRTEWVECANVRQANPALSPSDEQALLERDLYAFFVEIFSVSFLCACHVNVNHLFAATPTPPPGAESNEADYVNIDGIVPPTTDGSVGYDDCLIEKILEQIEKKKRNDSSR